MRDPTYLKVIVEQPTSSLLWYYPRMERTIEVLSRDLKWVTTFMGAYWGQTEKGMKLYGTAPFLAGPSYASSRPGFCLIVFELTDRLH